MLKLIIAEDEVMELNSLVMFFNEYYSDSIEIVAQCKNGKEAVEAGLSLLPDIAVLDIQMPVKNGLEVAKELHDNDPGIAIVILTAHSLFAYAKEAISIGVKDYVLKPYDASELRLVIDKILDKNIEELKTSLKNIVTRLSNSNSAAEDSHPVVRLAMNYLHDNYMKRISMEIMADDIGYSASYISKCLVKYLGKNFNTILLEIRCNEAVKLLSNGNFRVNEVAYAVGFSDPNYFNRCFKQFMGSSPKKYLNAMAGNIDNGQSN